MHHFQYRIVSNKNSFLSDHSMITHLVTSVSNLIYAHYFCVTGHVGLDSGFPQIQIVIKTQLAAGKNLENLNRGFQPRDSG